MQIGCLNNELAVKESPAYASQALSEQEDLQRECLSRLFFPITTTGCTFICFQIFQRSTSSAEMPFAILIPEPHRRSELFIVPVVYSFKKTKMFCQCQYLFSKESAYEEIFLKSFSRLFKSICLLHVNMYDPVENTQVFKKIL